jgi:hypothetical protein
MAFLAVGFIRDIKAALYCEYNISLTTDPLLIVQSAFPLKFGARYFLTTGLYPSYPLNIPYALIVRLYD